MLPTLTNAASKACGFQLGPQEGEAQWLANQGLWWFRPIGRTRGGFPIGHAAHFPDAVFMAFSGFPARASG